VSTRIIWTCPKCGNKITLAVEVKQPPVCSRHLNRKPQVMERQP
jgi:endogenous inhibitor of DNA gyrase (YacG/DUF329 family)